MLTPPVLTQRAYRAAQVLQAGGKFRYALETDPYTRRDKFHMRLYDARLCVVPGAGYATKVELETAGCLQSQRPTDARGSAWPQEWVWKSPFPEVKQCPSPSP